MDFFENKIEVRWSDCDPNKHVRHSAYYDYGAQNRIMFFTKIGFDIEAIERLNIGPILFKEECTFLRELTMGDTVRINLKKGEISPDGGRWVLHHEIFNNRDQKCAHITVQGAWMDLSARKLTLPPKEVVDAMERLESGQYYVHKSAKKTTSTSQ
ncbi:acyl-CoA thioesterase [Membranihabitans marinus]|uniref:acyl-CoA thioesterase n=1 Tax=Membranihabitans marinus TaxID=1227546 RepID=UPI001F18234C|nr:acyl-CoA thioesterase [Membranihabitans marinus]